MKQTFFLYLILLGLVTACIPDPVDIEIAQVEPRLVIASQMLTDSVVLVQVSRSFGALEFSETSGDTLDGAFLNQILVEHAQVTLSYSGGTETLLGIGKGFYIALNTPFYEGESYLLSVYDPTTGSQVYAESQVLSRAVWSDLDYTFVPESISVLDTMYSDTVLHLHASFEDLAGENYFMLNAYRILGPNNRSPDFLPGQSGIPTRIYSDQLYNDPLIRDTLTYRGFQPGDTVAFSITQISKGYYEYLSTRQRSGTSFFANLLQEPVNFPSNVDGGYGYFNLHLPSVEIRILE